MKYVVLLVSIFFILSESAFALRCGTRIVSRGDRKIEVLKKCGEPYFIETWQEETTVHVKSREDEFGKAGPIDGGHGFKESAVSHVEEWTYNFGPQRFIQFLTFVNGKLVRIEEGPKGFSGDIFSGSFQTRCGHLVETGDSKIEVIKKCGDPYSIELFWEERVSRASSKERIRKIPRFLEGRRERRRGDFIFKREIVHEERKVFVNIEEWIYNFGPRRFLYFITIENGRVVKVEEGDYGF